MHPNDLRSPYQAKLGGGAYHAKDDSVVLALCRVLNEPCAPVKQALQDLLAQGLVKKGPWRINYFPPIEEEEEEYG